MKKIKLNNIPETSDVSSLVRMIGFNTSGLITSQRVIGDISAGGMAVSDANLIYTTQGKGLSVLPTSSSTLNTPGGNGMLLHIQRAPKLSTSSSQIILQLYFSGNSLHFRTGRGEGGVLVYTVWKAI